MGSINLNSVLSSWYAAKAGVSNGSAGSGPGSSLAASAPKPPWQGAAASSSTSAASTSSTTIPAQATALMQSLMAGRKLIDPSAAKVAGSGANQNSAATSNYRNLFALYQGLNSLQSIAKAATAKNLSDTQTKQLQQAFQAGLQQVQTYLGSQPFKGFELYQTAPAASATTATAIPKEIDTYTTDPLYKGPPNGVVPAFQGDVRFSVTATKVSGAQVQVDFDLSGIAPEDRTFGNVLNYMNGQMADAGLTTRFADTLTPGKTSTIQAGSKSITLPAGPDQYSLKIVGTSAETLSFTALASDPGVYVAQGSGIATGKTPDAVQQLVKFDGSATPADTLAVNNQVFNQALGSSVSKATATASAPDGSVYVLANVTGPINGQAIQGSQDVALIKYDSTGKVVFTRTLGADASASATGLAVSADGSQVAIVGSSAGSLDPATKATSSGVGSEAPPQQGFVSVYDSSGDEQWTQMTTALGGTGGGVQPSSVAFGSNGMVYVAGQVDGHVLGASGSGGGGLDAYVQAFHATAKPLLDGSGGSQWVVSPSAAVQYGTTGQDHATGVAVSTSGIYVSSLENGDAVVRRFDASGTSGTGLTQSASLDLGSLQGGSVAGVAIAEDGSVILAGSTHNPALTGETVTQAYSGSGEEAFVTRLSSDLSTAGSVLTYLGGAGDQSASAVTVSGGTVYVAGQVSTTPIPGTDVTSAWNGYVSALDPTTGQISWSQTYSGKENEAAPAGIAVAQGGASVLDQLGLPGTIDFTPSQNLVSNTSLRPGDQFYIQTGRQPPVAVTISGDDTYATLAQKIARASNFTVKAVVLPSSAGNTLKLTPAYGSTEVGLLPGPSGRDALSALGLHQGVLTLTASKESSLAPSSTSGPATEHSSLKNGYSLNLSSSLNLLTPGRATAASAALSGAIATLKTIYNNMISPPAPASSAGSGKVPKYLTNQISNYQAALSRLSGG